MELPAGPRLDVPRQEPLIVGPAGEVGVGHLPDDAPGLALELLQREIEGVPVSSGKLGGAVAGDQVVTRGVRGRMNGHGPHGRRLRCPYPISVHLEVPCGSRMPNR